MSKGRIFTYSLLTLLVGGFLYLYIWEKPKLEMLVQNYIESQSKNDAIPFEINIGRTNFSIIPLQAEVYDTQFKPKTKMKKYLKEFAVGKVVVRPSLLDLLVGKFWISVLKVQGSKIDITIPETPESTSSLKKSEFNVDQLLKRLPLSQVNIQDIALSINHENKNFITTEALYLKAYNQKSSLILTVKDPNIGIKTIKDGKFFNFLADLQIMLTNNTVSISKIKIVKDSAFFLASGNMIYEKSPENYKELNIKTRVSARFEELDQWSNILYKNDHLKILKGELKTDIQVTKTKRNEDISAQISADIKKVQIEKLKLGDFKIEAQVPNKKQVNITSIVARLAGNNLINIGNGKVHIGKRTDIKADLAVKDAQLHSFLRDSGIADIPVWLNVNGNMQCAGAYEKNLKIDCPGALTVRNLKIQNKERNKNIVTAQKIDIGGTMTITEKNISYTANASLKETKGKSTGMIDFDKGFDIQYESENLNLTEVGPIADLEFLGTGSTKGSTKGNSDSATFEMKIKASNFEFEKYFFGELTSNLKYKSGNLYFDDIAGNLESTRYNGNLIVNLDAEKINGDIKLPFFRMSDIQQAVLKKVDLQNRFVGSGSGRIALNTPFSVSQMNFQLDARLFKGSAFGEDYNEATLKAEAVDGIIIIQKALLQKEKTEFAMKGTIDTELKSDLYFEVSDGFLQLSTMLKEMGLPVSGQFNAKGKIFGNLGSPFIKTTAEVKGLIFNKKKYGDGVFSYDNSNSQTNLQFNIPEKLEFLVILPESNFDSIFVDINCNKLDVAPMVGFLVSEEATRSYLIETSGEVSGKFDTKELWNSEFSSTIKNITFDYKANKIKTTIPTNIELKNGKIFLNEIGLSGHKQFIKITQPFTEKYRTRFVIDSTMNIAFFKLFAPFIEKIDGYSTLRLELSVNNKDLKIYGSSYTKDAFLKFPGFPHPFQNITADVLFNQNKVSINSISGELASGKILGNGEVRFPEKGKFDLFVNTNMTDINIDFPKGFKTTGSGSISLSGSKAPFLLAGTYNVEDGLIDSDFSSGGGSSSTDMLEELLKKEITSPLLLNIDINTKNPIEVRNALVEGYITGQLKVFDKISAPRIKGEAHFVDDSVVKFREQEFEVTSSNFTFEGQTPINPKLSLRSKTRMNSYDIELILQGRATNPALTLTSQPPLPQTQIISMLALGQLPDQFEQNLNGNNLNNQNNQGFEVGTGLLGDNPLAREFKKRSGGFDVQISSSFDDQTGAAVPKVTLKNKVTKKLEVSGSATQGNTNQMEGRVSYELNNEISTIFSIKNRPDDVNNIQNTNATRQNNTFGVDLEYKVEFD